MLKRLLITGAAGALGISPRARVAHRRDDPYFGCRDAGCHISSEKECGATLATAQAVEKLVSGCDGILHFGGVSTEDKFSKILSANIQGIFDL